MVFPWCIFKLVFARHVSNPTVVEAPVPNPDKRIADVAPESGRLMEVYSVVA